MLLPDCLQAKSAVDYNKENTWSQWISPVGILLADSQAGNTPVH